LAIKLLNLSISDVVVSFGLMSRFLRGASASRFLRGGGERRFGAAGTWGATDGAGGEELDNCGGIGALAFRA